MLILDLEIEHLARARQRGFQREAAIAALLKRAAAATLDCPDEQPRPHRAEQLGVAARFLARLAAHG